MNVENLCLSCMKEKPNPIAVCPHCGCNPAEYQVKPHHLQPLETILKGQYLLGRVLGEGGFGITYVALDLKKNQRVAIKELFVTGLLQREHTHTILVDDSSNGQAFYKECKEKFLQEAGLLRKLEDKKGVVNIFDFFEENSTAYIVMEYLEGDDLGTYLKKRGGRIPYEEAFSILRPVMKSLIGMHSVGVFHRDIAPDNIRYLVNGNMKIMDLGGAKYNYSEKNSSIIMVKPGYAPPEQYSSSFMIGAWMDVYAMAATIYRCITGTVPPPSIDRIDDRLLKTPRELGVDISEQIEKVLLKGMAFQVKDRYIDMREFYQALKKANQESGVCNEEKSGPYEDSNRVDIPGRIKYKDLLIELNGEKRSKDLWIFIAVWVIAVIIIVLVATFIL